MRTLPPLRVLLPLATLALCMLAPSSARAETIYMQVAGLTGEVTATAFPGAVEVESFTLATGGQPLKVVHPIDRATPGLLTAAAAGKVLESVTVTVLTDAGQTYLVLRLKEVVVGKMTLSQGDQPTVVETELRAARVEVEYSTADARGGKTTTERATLSAGK
ncbi:type VI secretion system tube protein Hcp [Myxococcota bacterium]|nr:type VI secretion system tube protein Hcp [Myxococcota bacterium]